MADQPSPAPERDTCVWCGARPIRIDDGRPIGWAAGDDTCDHETIRGDR